MQSSSQTSKPLIFVGGFLLFAQFINGLSVARNGYSAISSFWFFLAFYWMLGWWFINDSRQHGIKWVDYYMDMGMFLYLTWIVFVPYYLFKTRRWKAIYIIGVLLGINFGAYLIGAFLYFLINLL